MPGRRSGVGSPTPLYFWNKHNTGMSMLHAVKIFGSGGFFLLFCAFVHAQGMLDQPAQELVWESQRNLSESAYDARLEAMKRAGYRLSEVEITGGNQRTYACIWRKNSENRGWEVRTKLNDTEFSTKWAEMKGKGYRLIDQEVYVLHGQTFYAGLWIQNRELLQWVSFRKLSAAEFEEKMTMYRGAYLPVDMDVCEMNGQLWYAAVWVENRDRLEWVEKHAMGKADFTKWSDEYNAKGYRLGNLEVFTRAGRTEYTAVWIKEPNPRGWYTCRDVNDIWFRNHWLRCQDQGYRLEEVEAYETENGPRYAGIWLENNERVHWKYRKAIEEMADAYLKDFPAAGMSVGIAIDGKIRFLRGWGFQDVQAEKEAHANTVYRHASIAKALAGIIAFRLKAKNQLDLSAKTRDYEPRLPAHHTHTVGELLSNRGHVRHYIDHDPASQAGTTKIYPNACEASKLFSADPLVQEPYLYSTHSYTLAAAALEKAAGKLYPKLMEDELTLPLGLPTLRCEDLNNPSAERSKIYRIHGHGFAELTPLSLSWKYAGGGTESSAYDLLRLGIKLLNDEVLSPADRLAMTTPPDDIEPYAYGWGVATHLGEKVFAKSGGQPGARSYIRCYPDKKIVIVLLCNTEGKGLSDLGKAIGALLLR